MSVQGTEKKVNQRIYIVSFFEGAAVMATELCGTKLIAPYFGSSLYVWSAVIAITLGSLAAGYFFGGRMSLKNSGVNFLGALLVVAALYMGCMPWLSNLFGGIAIRFSLLNAVVICGTLLLFPPMFLMGATSPLIIGLQTGHAADSGRISGLVYSISTIGGIVASFLSGFFLIPVFGLQVTLLIFASLLLLSLLVLFRNVSKINLILPLGVLVLLAFSRPLKPSHSLYEEDGMLGRVFVTQDSLMKQGVSQVVRKLVVNSVVQTEMDVATQNSLSDYVAVMDSNLIPVTGKKALVLGLGGGVTANLLAQKGYQVKGVEIDERIIQMAKRYFYLNPGIEAICDDARHFVNTATEKFDCILIDIFKAEEQPGYVLSRESLKKIRGLLNGNGLLVINWHGYSTGERGIGTAILMNTLLGEMFRVKVASKVDAEDYRNLIFFAGQNEPRVLKYEKKLVLPSTELVNTDLQPVLERYNALANQAWRKNYIRYYYSNSSNSL